MKFRVGNRVEVSERLISRISSPNIIETLKTIGTVRRHSNNNEYVKVDFPDNNWYIISKKDLKLTKNTQLLFDFYTE